MVLTIVVVLAVVEAASYLVVGVLVSKDAIYRPAELRGVEHYLSVRDPQLGWPSPQAYGRNALDPSGARLLPAFPEPGRACVSAYGDSFVFGDEVAAHATWANQLALELGCRVANYGVNGYGTDQAYLRFHGARGDEARYALLGVFTNDIVRNVNQLRNLLAPIHEIGLKPRYIIDAHDDMQLLPLPSFDAQQLDDVVRHPERHLVDDYFAPGGPAGVVRARFPYSVTLLRALSSYKLGAVLRGESPYAAFYDARHPSRALEITARLCRMFVADAAARGKTALLVMFPSRQDLEAYAQSGRWTYQPLMEQLERDGQPVLNLGPALLDAAGERSPATLFKRLHYNEDGNRRVAEALAQALRGLPGKGFEMRADTPATPSP